MDERLNGIYMKLILKPKDLILTNDIVIDSVIKPNIKYDKNVINML